MSNTSTREIAFALLSLASLASVLSPVGCGGERPEDVSQEKLFGTSRQAITGGLIPNGTHFSTNEPPSEIKISYRAGDCQQARDEVYHFDAVYRAQGTRTSGEITLHCGNWDVDVRTTHHGQYSGHITFEDGRVDTMWWDTNTVGGVTWVFR